MVLRRLSKYLAALGLLLWSSNVLAFTYACGPDPVPPPAQAAGLTCEIFGDNFTTLDTFDVNNTLRPGFKWYLNNIWPGLASGRPDWGGGWHVSPPNTVSINPGGGLRLWTAQNNAEPQTTLMGCATNGRPHQWLGYAWSAGELGGLYVDWKLRSINPPGLIPNGGWVAVWAVATEYMSAKDPFPDWNIIAEWDYMESYNNPPAGVGRNMHVWRQNSTTLALWFQGGQEAFLRRYQTYGEFFDDGPKTMGALLIPAAKNGGTGFVRSYINEALDPNNNTVSWGAVNYGAWNSDDGFNIFEKDHFCLQAFTGTNQEVNIDWWRVWAPPPPPLTGIGRRR